MDYKEKLEEAKRLYETANADQRYVLESLFPELAESEDERIRKTLVEFFTDWGKSRSHCWSVSIPKILAWLEKQGEQKSAWSEDDEKRLQSCLNILQAKGMMGVTETINTKWLKSPKNRVISQPKSAWSEDDEGICRAIINDIANDKSMCKFEISKGLCDAQINWLNSLKQRIGG